MSLRASRIFLLLVGLATAGCAALLGFADIAVSEPVEGGAGAADGGDAAEGRDGVSPDAGGADADPSADLCPTVEPVFADAAPPPDTVCVEGSLPEKLTGSPGHCGACNHDCKEGATCQDGMCQMRV